MKKVLVILLILAVSAGAFAQGEWGVSANAKIETVLDGLANTVNGASAVNGDLNGQAKITYKIGGFDSYIEFNRNGQIGLGVTGNGDNYAFKASGNFGRNASTGNMRVNILDNTDNATGDYFLVNVPNNQFGITAGDLWGWYSFLDGMIQIQAAIAGGKIEGLWGSNDAGGGAGTDGRTGEGENQGTKFTVNIAPIDGLQFGFIIPRLFGDGGDIMQESLEKMMFGLKYEMADVFDAGATFIMKGDGTTTNGGYSNRIYVGFNLKMLPFDFGGSFTATMPAKAEDLDITTIKFGVKAGFGFGDFSASIKVTFEDTSVKGFSNGGGTVFGIYPGLSYKIIPESLLFKLDADIEIVKDKLSTNAVNDTVITIKPGIFYNFLQDGAGDDPGTGMYIKYEVKFWSTSVSGIDPSSATQTNKATIGFKWSI